MMQADTQKELNADSVVTLDADVAISGAAELKGRLLRLLETPGAVSIDASNVQRIDTAGLQLLCAFRKSLNEAGRALEWTAPSPAFTDGADRVGLTDLLGLTG